VQRRKPSVFFCNYFWENDGVDQHEEPFLHKRNDNEGLFTTTPLDTLKAWT